MRRKMSVVFVLAIIFSLIGSYALAASKATPLRDKVRASVGDVRHDEFMKVPVITWGADFALIYANGLSAKTVADSMFGREGIKLEIFRQDDVAKQLEMYIKGETPFFRGTVGMNAVSMDVMYKDPQTEPVAIYQYSWSSPGGKSQFGGDTLVVGEGIKTLADLKGKRIAINFPGPHMPDLLEPVLRSAGLMVKDVKFVFTEGLMGMEGDTPPAVFAKKEADAAFMLINDALALTSGGTVGTGGESVKGARIILTTKTTDRAIADVIYVRSDYFEANKASLQKLAHILMLADQELAGLYKNRQAKIVEYKKTMSSCAKIILDSPEAVSDAEALYESYEAAGFRGNVKFFGDEKWSRNFERLNDEIQGALVSLGILSKKYKAKFALWDYDTMRAGLAGIDDFPAPKYKAEEVQKIVSQKNALNKLEEGELIPPIVIYFKLNEVNLGYDDYVRLYKDQFDQAIELSQIHGGAIFVVEGHSDPYKYNDMKKRGESEAVLRRIAQANLNTSTRRSLDVMKAMIRYAAEKGVILDESLFTYEGQGFKKPVVSDPKTSVDQEKNMRVVFRMINLEAEAAIN